MNIIIPDKILDIYKKFEEKNFKIYLVGGCVRNLLLKKNAKDWDMTTNATPQEMLKLFPDGFYDNQFGTVGIPVKKAKSADSFEHLGVVEATTFRTEHGYADRRHPQEVSWGKTIEEDLSRRDFTINAIALRIKKHDDTNHEVEIIDPFNGQEDLKNKTIKAVGDPKKRFKEDALRLLRAVRLSTQLSFNIEEETWNELLKDAHLIKEISQERIKDELFKILASDYFYEGIMLLKDSDLMQYILPELLEGIGVSQVRPGRHHTSDVFTHNVLSLKFCPSADPVVRFATLLHDVGKPKVASTDEKGLVIFHNHEIAGAKLTREICDRLKFSKKERDKIVNLIRWHMFTVDEKITDAAVRRFIRRVGVENVKDMMDLRIGDRLGGGTQTAQSWRLKLFKKRVEEQLTPAPFSINDLEVDGNDIMKILNIKPGPKVGEILQKLFEEVDEDLSRNKKEYLLRRIKELSK
ncbi:CCA tRNA nucleotidyltransferase [Patescibacteria group bacterium]|nr:CCA tRNA nucleotidyltransferase [Patescibacteria group bacterium]